MSDTTIGCSGCGLGSEPHGENCPAMTQPKPDLAELRKLLAEATPGLAVELTFSGGNERVGPYARLGIHGFITPELPQPDARLIAAAVNALPGLLDEVEMLRKSESGLKDIIKLCKECGANARIERALAHLDRIGPPVNTCVGDPVCSEQDEWPQEQWCDACLANAARAALQGDPE